MAMSVVKNQCYDKDTYSEILTDETEIQISSSQFGTSGSYWSENEKEKFIFCRSSLLIAVENQHQSQFRVSDERRGYILVQLFRVSQLIIVLFCAI